MAVTKTTNEDWREPGVKDDAEKTLAGVLGDFALALKQVAVVGTYGAHKYSRNGWVSVEDGEIRYNDALWRHLLAMHNDLDAIDSEHGQRHLAALAWNALALLELRGRKSK